MRHLPETADEIAPLPDWLQREVTKMHDEPEQIERDFDADMRRLRARMIAIAGLFLAVLLAFCVKEARAEPVAVATPGPWDGYAGTRIVVNDAASLAACMDALKLRGVGTYSCRTSAKVVVTDVTPPPPTCTAPKPDESRPGTCPANTTGSWTQTRTATAAPYPTCWTTTAWAPTDPPAGACVAIPPPTTLSLVYSLTPPTNYKPLQGATITGKANVRVSDDCSKGTQASGPWTFYVAGVKVNTESFCPFGMIDDNALYDFATFSGGPVKVEARSTAVNLAADITAGSPPPPVGTGTSTLRWEPPTKNTDGSTLADLAGFRILYGPSASALTQTIDVANPSLTTYIVTGLTSGAWYFTVRAYNVGGTESPNANTASKVVP